MLDRRDVALALARLLAAEPGSPLANRRAIELATLLLGGGGEAAMAGDGSAE